MVGAARLLQLCAARVVRSQGFNADVFQNKPVVGICNFWSELNNCNAHLRTVAEAVKRGVWAAGGFPLEFPTISLGELFMRPTTRASGRRSTPQPERRSGTSKPASSSPGLPQ
jgi:dihydroxyacid dehydratase/phosphogluconate dehydratase